MLKFNRLEVVCQVCNPNAPKEVRTPPIAKFDPENMPYPMNGMYFEAMRPEFGASPFLPGQGWEFMSCPMCHTRPFLERNQIATTKGMYILGEGLQLDRELLTEAELTELEYLEYQAEETEKALEDMNEVEMVMFAEEAFGLKLDSRLPRAELIAQIKKAQQPNPLQCPECGKVCKSKAGLVSHMKSHE